MAWQEFGNPIVNIILFVIAGWLVSLSLHEYAHALFAYRSGDRGVAERGYLTLNPLKYAHPVLSIVPAGAVPAAGRHRPARRRGVGRPARGAGPAQRQPDQRGRSRRSTWCSGCS